MELLIKFWILALSSGIIYGKPTQIHLSLGANPTEMMVTFTTLTKDAKSEVRYNKLNDPNNKTVEASTTKFTDKLYKVHIHRAKLTGLEPDQIYEYECGIDGTWSDTFKFKALSDRTDTSIRLAVYGDLGLENGISIPQLKKDVENGLYDTILHIGDIAYNLDSTEGSVGDKFMELIEPIAANVPYQTCAGNHEEKRNFTHYLNRFSMIDSKNGQINNHYYSFDLGPAHFIFFSSEFYFWPQYFDQTHIQRQYQWLENDLIEATKVDNRNKRPWLLTFSHRPMYCLDDDNDQDCYHYESVLRIGRSGPMQTKTTDYGLEDLFHKYGVDIQFYGHKHVYERSYPLYNNTATKTGQFYDNPKAPIHIVTGAAGTTDRPSKKHVLPDWVAFVSHDWSFTRVNIANKTHISFEQFSTEHNKVVDSFVIRKEHHL